MVFWLCSHGFHKILEFLKNLNQHGHRFEWNDVIKHGSHRGLRMLQEAELLFNICTRDLLVLAEKSLFCDYTQKIGASTGPFCS